MLAGFNLLLWTTHLEEKDFHLLEILKRVGYDGVEVPVFEGDQAHFRRIAAALNDNGLRCTTVTILPDEARNAVSADPAARQGALDHLAWAIECSDILGSRLLAGPYHQVLATFSGSGPSEAELERLAEVHRHAADLAAETEIVLAIEPLNRFECYMLNTMAQSKAHCARVARSNFGVLYDTFHANIEEQDPIGVIAETSDVIRHVHISENDRGTPGRGHVDFVGTCRALRAVGYDGWLTIEAFGQALPALAAATRVWRDFFPSREQVYTEGLRTLREAWAAGAA